MFYINFLRLLFLFFLNFKLSILSKVSYDSEELAEDIFHGSYIYSFERMYEEDEQEFLDRINDIYYNYDLYTYIYYIESIDEDIDYFQNNLFNELKNYFGYNFYKCVFIIMRKDLPYVYIIMGRQYVNKFTINKSNNFDDLVDYIFSELSNNLDNIEKVFDYSIELLEIALEGKEMEPGNNYKNVEIISIVIIVIIAIVIIVIYNICCKRNKIVSIGYKTYDPLK